MMMRKLLKPLLRKIFWGFLRFFLSDRQYAKFRYWLELDQPLNLENPRRFTEKIQYIKLHERTQIRKTFANRTAVRDYVAQKASEEYLLPLIGIYDELTKNIWKSLPRQFVLKANHGCEMLRIVFDKNEENYSKVHDQTQKWQETDYARLGREWVYEDLPRTIVAEELLLTKDNAIPRDYKFFCFHGRVEIIQIDFDRFGDQRRNLYGCDFNRLDATLLYPQYDGEVKKPARLDKAIEVAEALAKEVNFVRVDLYLLNDQIYFGELTNYPGSGFVPFQPEGMEYKVGSLLNLDKGNRKQ